MHRFIAIRAIRTFMVFAHMHLQFSSRSKTFNAKLFATFKGQFQMLLFQMMIQLNFGQKNNITFVATEIRKKTLLSIWLWGKIEFTCECNIDRTDKCHYLEFVRLVLLSSFYFSSLNVFAYLASVWRFLFRHLLVTKELPTA